MGVLKGGHVEEFAQSEFGVLANNLASAYDYPELEKAQLVFIEGDPNARESRHDKDTKPFYVRQFDSRQIKFEFDKSRYDRFSTAFKNMYDGMPLESRGLDRLATMFYLGCGMVRPITEYEFFVKHAPLKPQHANAVRSVYGGRKDLQFLFEDMFGIPTEEPRHALLVDEIPDEEITPINTTRIALSFLYGGLRREVDRVTMGELTKASQLLLYTSVVHTRQDYQYIASHGHGDDGAKKGDWLFLDTLPGWLLAFASPIKAESYGSLSEKFWQDRFAIKGIHDMSEIRDGLDTMCIETPIVDYPVEIPQSSFPERREKYANRPGSKG